MSRDDYERIKPYNIMFEAAFGEPIPLMQTMGIPIDDLIAAVKKSLKHGIDMLAEIFEWDYDEQVF